MARRMSREHGGTVGDEYGSGERRGILERVVGAPISWGVCEVPGWGLQLPVERVLAEMHELGLTATELGAIGWLPTDPAALRGLLDAHRLRVVAAFVPLAVHDADRREETLARANRMAELLDDIGAEHFVTAAVSDPDDWQRPELTESNWTHLIAMLDEIEAITTAHGLHQVLHPHVNTLVETADELQRVLDASPVPICLDTGHVTIGGADPLELATKHAERVGLVHLKDVRTEIANRLNAGELTLMAAVQAGLFAPLGEGDVPLADVITALEQRGYTGQYVLEQDVAITGGEPPPGEGPARDVAKSVAYLRSVDASLSATLRNGGRAVAGSAPTTEQRGNP
jgi:inosose dehydratase